MFSAEKVRRWSLRSSGAVPLELFLRLGCIVMMILSRFSTNESGKPAPASLSWALKSSTLWHWSCTASVNSATALSLIPKSLIPALMRKSMAHVPVWLNISCLIFDTRLTSSNSDSGSDMTVGGQVYLKLRSATRLDSTSLRSPLMLSFISPHRFNGSLCVAHAKANYMPRGLSLTY